MEIPEPSAGPLLCPLDPADSRTSVQLLPSPATGGYQDRLLLQMRSLIWKAEDVCKGSQKSGFPCCSYLPGLQTLSIPALCCPLGD